MSTTVTLDGPLTVTEGWANAGAAVRTRARSRRMGRGLSLVIVSLLVEGLAECSPLGPGDTVQGGASRPARVSVRTCARVSILLYESKHATVDATGWRRPTSLGKGDLPCSKVSFPREIQLPQLKAALLRAAQILSGQKEYSPTRSELPAAK